MAKDSDSTKKKKKKSTATKTAKVGKTIKLKSHSGVDALAKLADHPLVAELIAAGALAAVAAIAERTKPGKEAAAATAESTKAVKAAGKAAAAAIGKRLISEFTTIKDAATDAAIKAAKKS